jgi:D-hydroxyproline dehydrogenase subunit alpha
VSAPGAFQFQFEGQPVPAERGDTIGAALARVERLALGVGPSGDPRGLYCGIGVCFECVVDVEGVGRVRSCLQRAEPGMRVRAR